VVQDADVAAPPRRWSGFKPSPWREFRLSRRADDVRAFRARLVWVEMANERLFDEGPRSDGTPGRHLERSYHFLNRRAGAFWDRVRDHIETCYAAFPDEHKSDLYGRLRHDDQRQHLPAWWELYTFTLFDRLGYSVEVHPQLAGSPTRPDFLVTRGSVSMYVEAAVVFNDLGNSDAWNWVCDCVNDAENPDFMVDLEIPTQGKQRPRAKKIIDPLEKWLATLDADAALADQAAGRPLPHIQLPAADWVLDYTAAPVSPERRGIGGRLIAIYPTSPASWSRDGDQLRKTLSKKGSKYNNLDKPLDKPLVAAIASSSSIDEFDFKNTLFGSTYITYLVGTHDAPRPFRKLDGYWRPGSDPRGSRISAVLFGDTMRAWTVASRLPQLWINPWGATPTAAVPPFATVEVDAEGNFVHSAASSTAAHVFGLPTAWPNG
jgi:hypothetical protein